MWTFLLLVCLVDKSSYRLHTAFIIWIILLNIHEKESIGCSGGAPCSGKVFNLIIRLFYWRTENEISQGNNFGLNDSTRIRMWMSKNRFEHLAFFLMRFIFASKQHFCRKQTLSNGIEWANLLKIECHAQPTQIINDSIFGSTSKCMSSFCPLKGGHKGEKWKGNEYKNYSMTNIKDIFHFLFIYLKL